jgi:hypothetical protein
VISATRINISEIDKQVLKIIAPMLAEMEELEVQLTEEEFVMAGERMMAGLLPQEKECVLRVARGRDSKGKENGKENADHRGNGLVSGAKMY